MEKIVPNYFYVKLEASSQIGWVLGVYPGEIYSSDGSRHKRRTIIRGIVEWDAWLEEVRESTGGDYSIMGSSSIDFPEELTDDEDLINLCREISKGAF